MRICCLAAAGSTDAIIASTCSSPQRMRSVSLRVNQRTVGAPCAAYYDNDRKHALKGLPLVQLGLALAMQGDKQRGGDCRWVCVQGGSPRLAGRLRRPLRDAALMIAITHERGYSKPAYDAAKSD